MKKLKALLWIPVPLLLYWALRDIRFAEILVSLRRLTGIQLLLLLAVNSLFIAVIASRWAIILRGLGASVKFLRLLRYRLAGFAVSYLTPGPQFGGEPLQVYLAHVHSGVGYEVGSASVLLDKTFELLGNFAFLGLATLCSLPFGILRTSRLGLAFLLPSLIIALPAAYLTAVLLGVRPLTRIARSLPAGLHTRPWFHKLAAFLEQSESRIVTYCSRRGRTLLQVLAFFVCVGGISLLEMWLILRFLGVAANLQQTLFILAGAKFAFLLPFPGALGALELIYTSVFELLGYGGESALSLVLYMRARDLLFAAAGIVFAVSGRIRRKDRPPKAQRS